MLKFGICNVNQLLREPRTEAPWVSHKEVAIDLYEQIMDLPDAEALAERVLLRFMDERRNYKRTYAGRFRDFDREVVAILNRVAPDPRSVVIDHGVSDGRTACEFFRMLVETRSELQYQALDYDPEVIILRSGAARLALSSRGTLLQVTWPPFVFNALNRDSLRRFPLNHLIRFLAIRLRAAPILRSYRNGTHTEFHSITLFCPQARRLAETEPRFRLGKHSILETPAFPAPATLVRAMNLLNPTYFTAEEIHRAAQNVLGSLGDGGLFVTGSNEGPGTAVDGGVYQKDGPHFKLLWSSGRGSPVNRLLLDIAKDAKHLQG